MKMKNYMLWVGVGVRKWSNIYVVKIIKEEMKRKVEVLE